MTDLQLLRQQVLLNPTDTALLAAFEDELLATGEDEQAAKVRIVRQNLHNDRPLMGETEDDRQCRLLFWMGLRPIKVADWLNTDDEGRVYPTDYRSERTFGQAWSPEFDSEVSTMELRGHPTIKAHRRWEGLWGNSSRELEWPMVTGAYVFKASVSKPTQITATTN